MDADPSPSKKKPLFQARQPEVDEALFRHVLDAKANVDVRAWLPHQAMMPRRRLCGNVVHNFCGDGDVTAYVEFENVKVCLVLICESNVRPQSVMDPLKSHKHVHFRHVHPPSPCPTIPHAQHSPPTPDLDLEVMFTFLY